MIDDLGELYDQIKSLPPVERGPFGKQINELKQAIEQAIAARLEELEKVDLKPIDVTAPMDVNSPKPELLPSEQGTIHPLSAEIERISEIFNRMGFVTEESREIDDQFHMFESLNFPKGHPARDDYDTFMTEETDSNGDSFDCAGAYVDYAKSCVDEISRQFGKRRGYCRYRS